MVTPWSFPHTATGSFVLYFLSTVRKAEAERARRNKDPSDLLVLKKETAPPTDFYHTNITALRSLGDKHPEVLAEWRAQRAAEFVSKNARSLEVPKAR